jgi:hypothetical protein
MAISNNSTGLRPGVCTSTTRPTAPYEGQMIYETDTDLTYVWGGSAWQQVSGGTAVGNSGLVYITSGSLSTGTTNFAGCFTSTYNNYRIVVSSAAVSGAADIYIRYLTTGTTPTSASQYYWAYRGLTSGAGSADSGANAAGYGYTGWSSPGAGGQGGVSMDIYDPFSSTKNTLASSSASMLGAGVYTSRMGMVAWDASTSFTGIQFVTASSETLTGSVIIYGYRKA